MFERESVYTRMIEACPQMLRLVGDARGNMMVENVVLNMYPQIKNHPRFDEFLAKLESTRRTGIDLYRSFLKFNHFIAEIYYQSKEPLPQNMAEGYLTAILNDDLTFEKWNVGEPRQPEREPSSAQVDDMEYQKKLEEETELLHDLLGTPPQPK